LTTKVSVEAWLFHRPPTQTWRPVGQRFPIDRERFERAVQGLVLTERLFPDRTAFRLSQAEQELRAYFQAEMHLQDRAIRAVQAPPTPAAELTQR
jgi:hypothetical protein